MAITNSKIRVQDVPPYLRVDEDGTIERLLGTETTPPTDPDPQTGVSSKDVVLSPGTGVSARLYLPSLTADHRKKLPLVVYYHGGAFLISSTADPLYHHMLNNLVKEAQIILVSIDYRQAPENPLPAAYDDSWAALKWVAEHASGRDGPETWITEFADFDRVLLAGDSAGANISHHMAIRAGLERPGLKISGILLVHPYFWGEKPIGSEAENPVFKSVVDRWWLFVCPSDKGCDDPLINPFVEGAPSLSGLGCGKVLVCVAGNDILRERGRYYFWAVMKSDWPGKAEFFETDGEDHVFHIMDPTSENSKMLFKRCAEFIYSV
ncbi:probable carboxylesterase 2 [Phtheirospermum japonicum]|uniref:Probable carboxylesterase 2 n=1 Tax=Phtheirospermum japonicum TaxID=374723 RepID=A0A830C5Y8_9LAMI|nr:probable carboxylesterase 2 [Phtheirospermum japonicum]